MNVSRAHRPIPAIAMTYRTVPFFVRRLASLGAAAAAVAASLGLFAASIALAQAPERPDPITLYVGEAHVINEPGVRRIAVGNGKVLQATALDDRQVLVLPEAPGQSTLLLWGRSMLLA